MESDHPGKSFPETPSSSSNRKTIVPKRGLIKRHIFGGLAQMIKPGVGQSPLAQGFNSSLPRYLPKTKKIEDTYKYDPVTYALFGPAFCLQALHAPLEPVNPQSEDVETEEEKDIAFFDVEFDTVTEEVRRTVDEEPDMQPAILEQLAPYISLFPASYEIEKDTLVELIDLYNTISKTSLYAGLFLQKNFIMPSRFTSMTSLDLSRVNISKLPDLDCIPLRHLSFPETPIRCLPRLPRSLVSLDANHRPQLRRRTCNSVDNLSVSVKEFPLTKDKSGSGSPKRRRTATMVLSFASDEFRENVLKFTGAGFSGIHDQLLQGKVIHTLLEPDVETVEAEESRDFISGIDDQLLQGEVIDTPLEPDVETVEAEESREFGYGDGGSYTNSAGLGSSIDEEFLRLPEDLKQLAQHCSLFPASYEFEKDTLVQLWMAGGYFDHMKFESPEMAGSWYFGIFLQRRFIMPSRFDHLSGAFKYKTSPVLYSVIKNAKLDCEYMIVEDCKLGNISEKLHLSLVFEELKTETFDALERCSNLNTLLLLPRHGCSIEQVPRSIFLRLRSLRSLDLSRSNISELPTSIGNVISLRYIDLSETPIRWLPETFSKLCKLQTLKLNDCLCLSSLPIGMKKLTSMRHLMLDSAHALVSMPPGIGNLTNLQTLSLFLVGGDYGCSIQELKELNNLNGKLCILRLENVSNLTEAERADLSDKEGIENLELHWSNPRKEREEEEEEVLRHLQPNYKLKELTILHYGGLKFPSWVSHTSFVDLTSITFFNCKSCQLLPSIGELPSLKFLLMDMMAGVVEIDRMRQGTCAFPKLEVFRIMEMPNLKAWAEVEEGDFPCLIKVIIESCRNLNGIPRLSYLKSLKHLQVSNCPELSFSPREGVPTSLDVLLITDCPVLKEHWQKEEGEDWDNISHPFSLWIDYQEILIG